MDDRSRFEAQEPVADYLTYARATRMWVRGHVSVGADGACA
jgi:hypothetical protein